MNHACSCTEDAHLTEGPGSGGYNLRTKPVGPKRTMSARHREGLHAGYPNFLVQPVDTLGEHRFNKLARPSKLIINGCSKTHQTYRMYLIAPASVANLDHCYMELTLCLQIYLILPIILYKIHSIAFSVEHHNDTPPSHRICYPWSPAN